MVDYAPLLTGSGIVPAYDPTAPCAPPPRPASPTYDPWGNDDADEAVDLSYNVPGVAAYEPAANNLSVDSLSSAGACEIERLRFLVRSPEEIVKLSAVEVTTANISVDGVPVRGGLRDPRFGPSAGISCATCHATCSKPCNGHFGHYGPLSEPLYNVHFVKQVVVWLRLICGECGEVQVDHVKRGGVLTMTNLREKQCRKCNAVLMRSMAWDKEQQTLLAADGEPITAKEALRRFCMVPDNHRLFEKKGFEVGRF